MRCACLCLYDCVSASRLWPRLQAAYHTVGVTHPIQCDYLCARAARRKTITTSSAYPRDMRPMSSRPSPSLHMHLNLLLPSPASTDLIYTTHGHNMTAPIPLYTFDTCSIAPPPLRPHSVSTAFVQSPHFYDVTVPAPLDPLQIARFTQLTDERQRLQLDLLRHTLAEHSRTTTAQLGQLSTQLTALQKGLQPTLSNLPPAEGDVDDDEESILELYELRRWKQHFSMSRHVYPGSC